MVLALALHDVRASAGWAALQYDRPISGGGNFRPVQAGREVADPYLRALRAGVCGEEALPGEMTMSEYCVNCEGSAKERDALKREVEELTAVQESLRRDPNAECDLFGKHVACSHKDAEIARLRGYLEKIGELQPSPDSCGAAIRLGHAIHYATCALSDKKGAV